LSAARRAKAGLIEPGSLLAMASVIVTGGVFVLLPEPSVSVTILNLARARRGGCSPRRSNSGSTPESTIAAWLGQNADSVALGTAL
jgi:hypothetical protein